MPDRQLLQRALNALETCVVGGYRDIDGDWRVRHWHDETKVGDTITDLRAAMAEKMENNGVSRSDLQRVADFLDPDGVGELPDPDTCQRVGKWLRRVIADGAQELRPASTADSFDGITGRPHRFAAAIPSEKVAIRMGGAVIVCSDNDAACAEVPAARRCAACPYGVTAVAEPKPCVWPDCGCYAMQGPGWCKRNAGVKESNNAR